MTGRPSTWVNLIGVVAMLGGLFGSFAWTCSFIALKGGSLQMRFGGCFPNVYVNVREFPESFLRITATVQLACCLVSLIGGVLLLANRRAGRILLIWQARVSAIINFVMVIFIAAFMLIWFATMGGFIQLPWTLTLRVISLSIDLATWIFLSSETARLAFKNPEQQALGAFPVILASQSLRSETSRNVCTNSSSACAALAKSSSN